MKRLIAASLLSAFLLLPATLLSQRRFDNYKSRWQADLSLGGDFWTNPPSMDGAAGHVIGSRKKAIAAPSASFAFFPAERFGIQAAIGIEVGRRYNEKSFHRDLISEYGDHYFTIEDYYISEPRVTTVKLNAGLVYRIERDRWFIYPKLLVGVVSLSNDFFSVTVKERGSNEMFDLDIRPGHARDYTFLTLGTGLTAGWKITRRIWVKGDVSVSGLRYNIDAVTTRTDAATHNTTSVTTNCKGETIMFNAGAGVIFVLGGFNL